MQGFMSLKYEPASEPQNSYRGWNHTRRVAGESEDGIGVFLTITHLEDDALTTSDPPFLGKSWPEVALAPFFGRLSDLGLILLSTHITRSVAVFLIY